MADLFDDLEEENAELNGVDDDADGADDEDVDEGAAPEEPQESAPAGAIVPQGKQGVFSDRESVFDTRRTVDHRNPVVTRAEETANELLPMRRPVSTKAQLVAVFDAQGRPFVAYHQNGRALERFRLPTPQEFEVLRSRGQLVKGGLGEAPAGAAPASMAPAAPPAPAPQSGGNKTWLYVGAAAVAVGGLAWWYMSKQKASKVRRNDEDADSGAGGADDGDAGDGDEG
jgi:hypothetical protein